LWILPVAPFTLCPSLIRRPKTFFFWRCIGHYSATLRQLLDIGVVESDADIPEFRLEAVYGRDQTVDVHLSAYGDGSELSDWSEDLTGRNLRTFLSIRVDTVPNPTDRLIGLSKSAQHFAILQPKEVVKIFVIEPRNSPFVVRTTTH
jgi:hypothetical protein